MASAVPQISPPATRGEPSSPISRPDGIGPVALDAVDRLVGLIDTDDGLGSDDGSLASNQEEAVSLPWYRRRSPWWILFLTPISAMALGATIAPRVEILTRLVCLQYRPEYATPIDSQLLYDARNAPLFSPHIPNTSSLLPDHSQECTADPVVQAAVASFLTAMTTTVGIISCLTAGWWGRFSDRNGRKPLLAITALGALIADLSYILVSHFSERLPTGYYYLIITSVIEGSAGGIASAAAATHAYISDSVSSTSRARYLAISLGVVFTGMSIGPALGSLLISYTSSIMTAYYLAFCCHLTYISLALFVIPESLPKATRIANIAKQNQLKDLGSRLRSEAFNSEYQLPARLFKKLANFLQSLFFFLRPLAMFLPKKNRKGRKDWNITAIALSLACGGLLLGSYPYKIQYAGFIFGWRPEELGYWLSLVTFTRASYLLLILPILIKLFGPKLQSPIALSSSPGEPLDAGSNQAQHVHRRYHTPAFDLTVARISLAVDVVAYTMTAIVTTPACWVMSTLLAAFGGGFSPAMQSLAVELTKGTGKTSEVGELFGALGVVQALSSQIIGPSLFGMTYMATVGIFPRAIFVVATIIIVLGFFFLSLVRLPQPPGDLEQEQSQRLPEEDI